VNDERLPSVLTIAGSDSSGGAGIQADLKTFMAFGVHGATVLTALTAQNTRGVRDIHLVPPAHIAAQFDAVRDDLDIRAIKTGMLGGEAQAGAVADCLEQARADGVPLVVDPVMVAASGARLLESGAEQALIARILPLATVLTPNLHEAAAILRSTPAATAAQAEDQARAIHALGCRSVLVKGGHAAGDEAVDILFDGDRILHFSAPRIATRNVHGTGCTLASAIAAGLALGVPLPEAVARAKRFLSAALAAAAGQRLGRGPGPVDHRAAMLETLGPE
jgi:hydroxymethylpyrimidine/phosphomethylpyrimidine kinase